MVKTRKVFISASKEHDSWVREFVRILSESGVDVWWDEEQIAVGEPFGDKLEEGLRTSDYMIMIVSPDSIESPWFNFEMGAALGRGSKIIPIVAKDVNWKDLPGPIRARRFLTMESPEESAEDVKEALAAAS
jgi:predicted nucleotide-binding protein